MGQFWLIFIISLPTQNATGCMRVWRALSAPGCGVLCDGVYLLPHRTEFRQAFQAQAEEVKACGGNVHILLLDSENKEQQSAFEELFDRSEDYAKLLVKPVGKPPRHWRPRMQANYGGGYCACARILRHWQRWIFFPGAAREQVASVLEDLAHRQRVPVAR